MDAGIRPFPLVVQRSYGFLVPRNDRASLALCQNLQRIAECLSTASGAQPCARVSSQRHVLVRPVRIAVRCCGTVLPTQASGQAPLCTSGRILRPCQYARFAARLLNVEQWAPRVRARRTCTPPWLRAMLTTLRGRLLIGIVASLWAGGAIVVLPDRGWIVLVIVPFLLGQFYAYALRTWWSVGLLPVAYLLGALGAAALFPPEDALTFAEAAGAALAFALGLTLVCATLAVLDRRSEG